MKNPFLLLALLSLSLIIAACGKEDDPEPEPVPAEIYYYDLSYDGDTYEYESKIFQAGHSFRYDVFGGWVGGRDIFGDAASIKFVLPDSAKNIDLNDMLVGKRIYFNGIAPYAEVIHNIGIQSRWSADRLDSTYFAEVTEISYLRTEEGIGVYDIYSVRGSYRAQIENEQGDYVDAEGEFFAQCSHAVE